LVEPNPDDPLMPEIAWQLKKKPEEFDVVAREWTEKYAKISY
jgi:ubiquitin-protein ligase